MNCQQLVLDCRVEVQCSEARRGVRTRARRQGEKGQRALGFDGDLAVDDIGFGFGFGFGFGVGLDGPGAHPGHERPSQQLPSSCPPSSFPLGPLVVVIGSWGRMC